MSAGQGVPRAIVDPSAPDPALMSRLAAGESGALGGPLQKDRIWFFGSSRRQGSSQLANMYHNKNAGDPTAWT